MAHTRERTIQWEDPFARPELLVGRSGLELLQAIVDGEIPPPPMAMVMNSRLVEVEHGRAVFEGEAGEEHYNPSGVVHGGYAMTLLDSALGCAVHSTLPAGALFGTIDVHVRLLRAITKDTGMLRCEAKVVSLSRTLGTSEARITDRSGNLLATGTTACAIRLPSP